MSIATEYSRVAEICLDSSWRRTGAAGSQRFVLGNCVVYIDQQQLQDPASSPSAFPTLASALLISVYLDPARLLQLSGSRQTAHRYARGAETNFSCFLPYLGQLLPVVANTTEALNASHGFGVRATFRSAAQLKAR